MKKHYGVSIAMIVCALSGCGDRSAQKTAEPANATADAKAHPPIVKYQATPAEGINFKLDGSPIFVTTMNGIGEKESFGRWSVGDEVTIGLANPLPSKFTVELDAAAFGPNVGKPIKMLIGSNEQEFSLAAGHPESMQKVTLLFADVKKADAIKIKIPFATSPKTLAGSTDERRLGVALGQLKIYE